MAAIKRYFLTGLLVLVPLGITFWVMTALLDMMDQTLLLLPPSWQPEAWLGMYIPGLGLLLTAVVVLVTGVLATNLLGQRLVALWEGLLNRIPVVKSIYGGVKQVSETLFSDSGLAFKKVLLVRYPHPQAWALAFLTNVPDAVAERLPQDHVAVFVPSTPSPANGFYFYVPRAEVIELDLSVDAAIKAIVSMGVVTVSNKPNHNANLYPGD